MEPLQTFLRRPLSGGQYAVWGISLMVFKYLVEVLLIVANGGGFYSPLAFLLPFNQLRVESIAGAPDWVTWFILLWSLPFGLLALLLSVRRVVDMGVSAWQAMWILCPLVNLFLIVAWCWAPSKMSTSHKKRVTAKITSTEPIQNEFSANDATRSNNDEGLNSSPLSQSVNEPFTAPVCLSTGEPLQSETVDASITVLNTIGTMIAGLGITILVLLLSIYCLGEYGASIFFSAPILLGVITGYSQTRQTKNATTSGAMAAIGIACGSIFLGCGVLVLLSLEGVICILMALPIMLPAAAVGGLVGHLIAVSNSPRGPSWMVILILTPTSATIEHALTQPSLFEVVSVVEVNAPPEEVWQQVVAFPDIDSQPGLLFQLGVAYPVRARIEGAGVGAVRYCQFSTGDFVEPITVWDPPHHLAFSVEQQPCPLTELSPYEEIHPPHLDGFLKSHQGEFRLTALPGGRTKLEGHTWYTIDMYPQLYWKVWTDKIIHSIHGRVLKHIAVVSESQESTMRTSETFK